MTAAVALIGIIPAVSVGDLVGLVGGTLRLFLAGIGDFAETAQKVAVPRVPKPARWTKMSAGEPMPHSRSVHRLELR